MYVDSFSLENRNKRFATLIRTLNELNHVDYRFLTKLEESDLRNLLEACEAFRSQILNESAFNNYYRDPEYTTNTLLAEAIRIVLSEFKPPSRRRVKRRRKTNEAANYIVFSKDGVPVHSQADANQAKVSARIWDDPHKHRLPDTVVAQGPVKTFFTPDWKNPVEEYERDDPIEDEIETEGGYGLPTAQEVGRLDYPVNKDDTEGSPGTEEVQATSYVMADHPEQNEDEPEVEKCQTGQPYAHPAIDQRWMDEDDIYEGDETMANNSRLKKYQALRERKDRLQKQLAELRKQRSGGSLSTLLEGELERAELILSAKDTINNLQDMAEDLGKMQVNDLMPLVDSMKGEFGPELADMFEETVNNQIGQALEAVKQAREQTNNAILRLEGKLSNNDMEAEVDIDAEPETDLDLDVEPEADGAEGEVDLDFGDEDEFGGAEAGEGPEDEPLGRAKKESRKQSGRPLAEGKQKTYAVMFNSSKVSREYPGGVKVKASSESEAQTKARDKVKKELGSKASPVSVGPVNESDSAAFKKSVKKGDKVKITGGDHKGKTGTIKKQDVRGPNALVTVGGNDEYIKTANLKKATNESHGNGTGIERAMAKAMQTDWGQELPEPYVRDLVQSVLHGDAPDDDAYEAMFSWALNSGEMPYGTAKARTGDPDQWIFDKVESAIMENRAPKKR